jgi:hypothetical protein
MNTVDTPAEKRSALSEAAVRIIYSTIPWMRFMAIMSFIGIGFLLFGAVMLGSSGFDWAIWLMALYFIFAVIGFFPALYLLQYANNLAYYIQNEQMQELERSLTRQKSYFVYVGSLLIIMIGLQLIRIIFYSGSFFGGASNRGF